MVCFMLNMLKQNTQTGLDYFTKNNKKRKRDNKMPMTAAKCTQCNANLQVDSTQDATICKHCGTPFIVEKAINLFKTTIHARTTMVFNTPIRDFEIRGGVLAKYHGSAEEVIVPKGVLEIGYDAFAGCANLRKIALPDGIEVIAHDAFNSCTRLQSVQLSNGLTTIGGGAFSNCSSLKRITLPSTITSIDSCAFYYCESLEEITIPTNIFKAKMYVHSEKNCIVPDAFKGCSSLKFIIAESPLLAWQLKHWKKYFPAGEYIIPVETKIITASTLSQKDKQMYEWMDKSRCRYCGGKINNNSYSSKNNCCKSCGKICDYML